MDEPGAIYALIRGEGEIAKDIAQLRNQTTDEHREFPLSERIAELQD